MIEIERKFRLAPAEATAIEQKVIKSGGEFRTVHQVDEVYLQGTDTFADFKQGTPVVRLRTENDIAKLAYKRQVDDGGNMLEHETVVESPDVMRAILLDMGYQTVTRVEKTRKEASVGGVALMIDRVVDLGYFLEVEVLASDDSEREAAERSIMETAASFGLGEDAIEARKYDRLITDLKTKED